MKYGILHTKVSLSGSDIQNIIPEKKVLFQPKVSVEREEANAKFSKSENVKNA